MAYLLKHDDVFKIGFNYCGFKYCVEKLHRLVYYIYRIIYYYLYLNYYIYYSYLLLFIFKKNFEKIAIHRNWRNAEDHLL